MWLVLCGSTDLPALWAYRGLQSRGLSPLELVSTELLLYNRRCVHRVGSHGASVEMTLADGRTIDSATTRGVLNRLLSVAPDDLITAHPDDRDYATQEQFAYFLSWLSSLPAPTLNPPTPQGLSGQWRHAAEWTWLALQAGLAVVPYAQSARGLAANPATAAEYATGATIGLTVLVIGPHVVGDDVPDDLAAACRRLAALARTPLLGVDFAVHRTGTHQFVQATPWPDLRVGGEQALDALASALRDEPGSRR